MKHSKLCLTIAALLLSATSGAATAVPEPDAAERITTIVGLTNIQQIGSTQNINDANGNAIMANPNPYKVVVVPANIGNLARGTVLVSNIGNDGTTGTTLVKFHPFPSTGVQFNAATSALQGPADLAFNRDHLLVANSKGGNSVQVLNHNGSLLASITDPLFNNPWGVTTGIPHFFAPLSTFFVGNKSDAKVLRVDVREGFLGATFKVTQIAQLTMMDGGETKIDMQWIPFLKVGNDLLFDVLVVQDPANNRIAAIADASRLNTSTGTGTTIFQGTPLNVPGGIAINPFNNDVLVVNLCDNNLVEINAANASVVGTKAIDPLVVDAAGDNAALFGVTATVDKKGNLLVFYTDDNTNSLNALSAAPLTAP